MSFRIYDIFPAQSSQDKSTDLPQPQEEELPKRPPQPEVPKIPTNMRPRAKSRVTRLIEDIY